VSDYTTLIRFRPPDDYRWLIVQDGKTLASGRPTSDREARRFADEVIQQLTNPGPPSAA